MTRFAGKVVVVTGAAGGIGSALCRRFAREGATVALLDRNAGALATLQNKMSDHGPCVAYTLDVTIPAECTSIFAQIVAEHGGIDVLINNAGITHFSLCERTSASVYRRVMDVNFFGAVHCTTAALPSLIARRGSVAVMSSIAGFAPLLGRAGYAASKHALHGYFESLRCEVRRHGVSVTLICPGFTQTGLEHSALSANGTPAHQPRSLVGRAATPASVADAVVDAIARRKRIAILSPVGRLSWLIRRVCPPLYDAVMTRQLRAEFDRESTT